MPNSVTCTWLCSVKLLLSLLTNVLISFLLCPKMNVHCSIVKTLTILFPMLPLTIKLKQTKRVIVHSSIVKACNKGSCERLSKV